MGVWTFLSSLAENEFFSIRQATAKGAVLPAGNLP
jgi:hypothetical protein